MRYGYDVSSVQGVIDWSKVTADFAYIKTATGNDLGLDSRFANNVSGCKANGIPCGGYFFAYPLPPGKPGRSPQEQAFLFFQKTGGLGTLNGDLPPALDLEWPAPQNWAQWGCSGAQIADWGLACLEAITSLWGKLPLLYTYPDFWQHLGPVAADYAKYPLWLAEYAHFPNRRPQDGDSPTLVLPPWTDWAVWQHSGGGIRLPNGAAVDGDCMRDEVLASML